MITQLRVYFQNSPLINTQGNNFTIGYIDNTGELFSLSNTDPDLTISLIEPSSAKLLNNNTTILVNGSNSNITLRFKLTYLGYSQWFSYALVPPIPQITLNDIYSRLTNLLPKNVYTGSVASDTYADNLATSQVIYQLYNNQDNNLNFESLSTIVNNIYPSSGADGWEYYLTGNNRLLYQTSTQYGALLQHIYSCEINNNTNPYWLTYNISKYIYLLFGKQRYVYIGENVFSITNAFILSLNSLGNSLFLGNTGEPSKLIFYVLTDSPDSTPALTTVEQAQVTAFIRQLSPANMAISVDYTQSTSSLQLVNINNTYFEDPRQDNSYCIAFNQNILDQALGYTSHLDGLLLRHLTGFSITPISGTVLTSGNSYPITITSVPAWTGVLPLEQYFQIYSSDSSILTTSFDGTTLSLKALSVGSASVNLYLGTLNHSNGTAYNYTIM